MAFQGQTSWLNRGSVLANAAEEDGGHCEQIRDEPSEEFNLQLRESVKQRETSH